MTGRSPSASMLVVSIAVGHGDATLLKWQPAAGDPFVVLIDGGPKTGKPAKLAQALDSAGVHRIDVLVLTHCDADHVDGLLQLWNERPAGLEIGQYWGPCLPAFERHAWLFPARIKRGLDQARTLEEAFSTAAVPVIYPLEHHVCLSPDRQLKLTVLSPASRLIKRLLIASDAEDLFLDYPTPLGWLLQPEEAAPEDAFGGLRGLLDSRAFLGPEDIGAIAPATGSGGVERDSRARSWAEKTGQDPEFFGNNVLNDTSIVLLAEAQCETAVRRLLFTGDLENFCYLATRYPLGLHCDVVKAPHHGSRSFIGRDTAIEDVWQWLRPRAVLVSANGKHELPRTDFRDAVLRWGATLFCTCRRSREIVLGPQPAGSCHEAFACNRQEDVTIEVSAIGIASVGVACASGVTSAIQPLIQIRERIVEPSNILERFTERELLGHVDWLRQRLRAHHEERLTGPAEAQAEPVSAQTLVHDALREGRHPAAVNMDLILDRGSADNRFWVSPRQYANSPRFAYVLPSEQERRSLQEWIAGLVLIQVAIDPERWSKSRSLSETIAAVDTSFLAVLATKRSGFPTLMFKDAIWPILANWLCQHRSVGYQVIGNYNPTATLIFYQGADERIVTQKLRESLPDKESVQYFKSDETEDQTLLRNGDLRWVPNLERICEIMTFPWLDGKNPARDQLKRIWRDGPLFAFMDNQSAVQFNELVGGKLSPSEGERARQILGACPFIGAMKKQVRN